MAEVSRRIYFYKLTFFRLAPARNLLVATDDVLPIFRHVLGLPANYEANPNRYLELLDGNDLLMQIDSVSAERVRGQFAIKRRTKLPPIESDGRYMPLRLEARQGLAEISHFVYYPRTGKMGVEFNFFAPRLGKWQDYLTSKAAHLVNHIEPELLLSGDVRQTLQRLGRKTAAVIGVHRDQIDVVEQLDGSLQRSFQAVREMTNGLELQVYFKLGTRKRDADLHVSWLEKIPAFLGRRQHREALNTLKVFAYDEGVKGTVPVDLLEDSMVAVRKVTTLSANSKAVVSERMYQAIEEAYDQVIGQPTAAS